MAYIVSNDFRNKEYSGESEYKCRLVIGDFTVPYDQIAKIEIENPMFDSSSQENNGVFYIGTFISQKIKIKFKNLDGLDLHSGDNVSLHISQYVNNNWVEVPIGLYLIDDLAENYQETCEIECLDYSVKFKKNIDYSPCFIDEKATIDMILHEVCNQCGVELGSYPETNGTIETGQFDSTISGKRWISYIAELKGCNAKIDRNGVLNLIPLNQPEPIINSDNILNSYVTSENQPVIIDFANNQRNVTLKGDTEQIVTTGKNLFNEKVMIPNMINGDTKTYNSVTGVLTMTNASTDTYMPALYGNQTNIDRINVSVEANTDYVFSFEVDQPLSTMKSAIGGLNTSTNKYTMITPIGYSANYVQTNVLKFNTGNYTTVAFRIGSTAGVGTVTHFSKFQLEKASNRTSYEPYSNAQPSPSPDYPQEIKTVTGNQGINIIGKNLFDKSSTPVYEKKYTTWSGTFVNNSEFSIYKIYLDPSTTYTVTNSGGSNAPAICEYDANNNLLNGFAYSNRANVTFTTQSSTRYILASVCVNSSTRQDIDYYQVEKGSSATTYEAYKSNKYELNLGTIELCKIGDYQDKIVKLSGKNLFDKNNANILNAYFNSTTTTITDNSANRTIYIPCKPNTTYVLQKIRTAQFIIGYTNELPQTNTQVYGINSSPTFFNDNTYYYFTITTGSNAKYIVSRIYQTAQDTTITLDEVLNTIQLEENDQKTNYEPYGKGWYIEKYINKIVLDGSETSWALHNSNENRNVYRITINDKLPYTNNNNIPKMISSHFNPVPNNATWVVGNLSEGSSNNNVYFVVEPTYTLETFKTWLSTHNTTLYYVLANSTYTKITNNILLNQLNNLENATKQTPTITIDALQSASWKLGEKYEISKVTFDNGVISYTKGDDNDNTLYIRQDNPFILNQEAIDNIYNILLNDKEKHNVKGNNLELNLQNDITVGDFTLCGNVQQETTTGKNLLKPNALTSSTKNGITYSYDEATQTYTFNGTCTTDNTTIQIGDIPLNITTNTVASVHWVGGSVTNFCRLQIANDDWSKAIRVDIPNISSTNPIISSQSTSSFTSVVGYENIRFNNGTVANNLKVRVMVANSTDTTYEPYTNGASPNPDYSQPIETLTGDNNLLISGKNLLDCNYNLIPSTYGLTSILNDDGSITTTGKPTSNYVNIYVKDIITELEDGATYTMSSGNANDYIYIQITAHKKNGESEYIHNRTLKSKSFTVDKSIYDNYILHILATTTAIWGTGNRTITNTYQLEKNTTYTDFEKYKSKNFEINLGKNLFNGTYSTWQYSSSLPSTTTTAITINSSDSNNINATWTGNGYLEVLTNTYQLKPSTIYTISFTRTDSAGTSPRNYIYYLDENDAYHLLTNYNAVGDIKITFTTTKTGKIAFAFGLPNNSNGTTIDIKNIQVEYGRIQTNYVPYFSPIELCSVGDYKDEIYYQKELINLFDKDNPNVINAYVSASAIITSSNNDKLIYIPCKPNTTYSLQKMQQKNASNNRFRVGTSSTIPDINTTLNQYFNYGDGAVNMTYTFKTNESANYLVFYCYSNDTGTTFDEMLASIQIEIGENPTEYKPHGTGWYIKKIIDKVVFDGSESWSVWADAGNNCRGFYTYAVSNYQIKKGYETQYNNNLLSDRFIEPQLRTDLYNGLKEGIKQCGNVTTQYIAIGLLKSRLTDTSTSALAISSFQTWLSNNNVTVYYVRVFPRYIKVDNTILNQEKFNNIVLYKGVNNISSSGNLPFYMDLNYIGKSQFEMYSLQTRNYGDISLDAWDYITYTLGEDSYKTYNNCKLTYEMTIMSDTNVQISNKQQELTTNYIGGSTETQTRKLRTTVNALDNTITMEVENIDIALNNQSAKISGLEISSDAISQSVSSLQTLTNDQFEELNNSLNNYKTVTDDELDTINNKFSDYATTSDLVTITNSVNQITTDTYTKTEINSFLTDGSVKKLQTTSMTADENGLTFEKTNAKTKSNINQNGLTILDQNDAPILRAVYDDDIHGTVVETYRHQVNEYFIMGSHSRFEDYENGTGCFYID